MGCARSGTTLLRDILRLHPRLECPEETHFFRWPDPIGTIRYTNLYQDSALFKRHRELDDIADADFYTALERSGDKKELMDFYGNAYLKKQNNPEGRWFDKTPQHVYGLLLISALYPESVFIHIHRNPLNVVASLVQGKVMAKTTLIGGVNYWVESMMILNEYKKMAPQRLFEISYEKLTSNPEEEISTLLRFLGEDDALIQYNDGLTRPESNHYRKILSSDDIDYIRSKTEPFLTEYDYSF